jgi:hypothetical protein
LRIHRDPAFGRRMAEAGRRTVTERFTIDRMVEAQIACYRRGLPLGPVDEVTAEARAAR